MGLVGTVMRAPVIVVSGTRELREAPDRIADVSETLERLAELDERLDTLAELPDSLERPADATASQLGRLAERIPGSGRQGRG